MFLEHETQHQKFRGDNRIVSLLKGILGHMEVEYWTIREGLKKWNFGWVSESFPK